jgi:hypothetical protein
VKVALWSLDATGLSAVARAFASATAWSFGRHRAA